MPRPLSTLSPSMARLVERQMRNWEIARQQKKEREEPRAPSVEQFIAISRAAGLEAGEIAAALHDKLGWPVFDKEILYAMAGHDEFRERLYAAMDERDLGWVESFIQAMTGGREGVDDYFRRLTETVASLARTGHAVFIGRAVDLILPQDVGLRVRLIAPRAFCIDSYARTHRVSREIALRDIEQIDQDRTRFIRNHFRVEFNDPTRHDLVINMQRFNPAQATELILAALRARGIVRRT